MELRVLRYFLETAREGNMTRAAERLHITQPTMSKQLKDLETELGQKLFRRTNYNMKLTEAGMILRKRAEDILDIVNKTESEFKVLDTITGGDICVGCAESDSIKYFVRAFKSLQGKYPNIRCNMHSGNLDDIKEHLNKGLLDFALVMDYVDLDKYNYIDINAADEWGVVMLKTSPLAKKDKVSVDDLFHLPLICSKQAIEMNFPIWFGEKADNLNIVATYNLAYNASIMVKEGIGYAISYNNLINTGKDSELCFRPLAAITKSKMKLIWRKYQIFTPIVKALLDEMKLNYE